MLVLHMSAPHIGSHTPRQSCPLSSAYLLQAHHARQEIDSNLLCVHDGFESPRFIASDPNELEVSAHWRLRTVLLGSLQRIMHVMQTDVHCRGGRIVSGVC